MFRSIKFFFQKLFYGYSEKDLWGLDYHLAKLILPRLKAFYNMEKFGHPMEFTEEEWDAALNKMIYSFEMIIEEEENFEEGVDEIDWRKVQEGLELFGKYYCDLWD